VSAAGERDAPREVAVFARFSDRLRAVMFRARDEARARGHGTIGTGHLLLGLIGEPDGIAGRVLRELGVTLPALRSWILADGAAETFSQSREDPVQEPDPTG